MNTQTLLQLAPFIKLAKKAKKGELSNQDALSTVFSLLGIDGVDINDRSSCEAALSKVLADHVSTGKVSKESVSQLIEFAKGNTKGKKDPKDLLPLLPALGRIMGIDPALMSAAEALLI